MLYEISFTDMNFHQHFFLFLLDRKNYEESMMVRLNMPARQKNSKKRGMMSMTGQLSGITHFSDITALTGGEGGQVSSQRHHRPVRKGSCFTHRAGFKHRFRSSRIKIYFKSPLQRGCGEFEALNKQQTDRLT